MSKEASAEATVRDNRRKTRRKYSAEEKSRIVLEGIRGDHTVAELCGREVISKNLQYRWSKDFLEAGESRLVGDTKQQVIALKQENEQLKQLVAELAPKNRCSKKLAWHGHDVGRMMCRSQAEKTEIIHLVEGSELSISKTLKELDVPRSTFYRWYQRFQDEGLDGLADHNSGPRQFWNRIPDIVCDQVAQIALEHPDKSARQLAWHITDKERGISSQNRASTVF